MYISPSFFVNGKLNMSVALFLFLYIRFNCFMRVGVANEKDSAYFLPSMASFMAEKSGDFFATVFVIDLLPMSFCFKGSFAKFDEFGHIRSACQNLQGLHLSFVVRQNSGFVSQATHTRDDPGALDFAAETTKDIDVIFALVLADFYIYHCGGYSSTRSFGAQVCYFQCCISIFFICLGN
jgi:hypothetical protein